MDAYKQKIKNFLEREKIKNYKTISVIDCDSGYNVEEIKTRSCMNVYILVELTSINELPGSYTFEGVPIIFRTIELTNYFNDFKNFVVEGHFLQLTN